ncbi:glycerophosphodiester phosphodiesterase family protein [Shewanella baltica]|uniref:glycerophosphodiester phosphodiesterase family protein n=1 Tax=Shewanella baltica TaxID=62322 RepID=UPI003D025373
MLNPEHSYWHDTLKAIRRCGRKLIEFELLFTLVSAGIIVPSFGWLLRHLIAKTGNVTITNYDLIAFAMSPYGLLFMIITLFSSFTVFFTQRAGVTILAASGLYDIPIGPVRALIFATARLPVFIHLGSIYAACLLLLSVPFMGLGYLIFSVFLQGHDINYYLYFKPVEWYLALSSMAFLALLYLLISLYLWAKAAFSLTIIVSETTDALTALKRSWQLSAGNERAIMWHAAGWWLRIGALLYPLMLLISWGADSLLDRVSLTLSAELAMLALVSALIFMLSATWSLLGMFGEAFIILLLYRQLGEKPAGLERLGRETVKKTSELSIYTLSGVLVTTFLIMLGLGVYALSSEPQRDEILISAHRAGAARAPENTLAALRLAIAEKADYAEIDVQTAADGTLMVLHDADLMRIAGDPRRVANLSASEIQQLDAGRWHSAAFAGESVPTLLQMLNEARNKIGLNIELKYNQADPTLAQAVVALLQQQKMTQQVVITSLEARAIEEVQRLDPSIQTGLIVTQSIGDPIKSNAQFLAINQSITNEKFIARAHKGGKQVHVWTVNNPRQMLRMLALGADVLITDYPQEAVEIREQWLSLSPVEQTALRLRYVL